MIIFVLSLSLPVDSYYKVLNKFDEEEEEQQQQ